VSDYKPFCRPLLDPYTTLIHLTTIWFVNHGACVDALISSHGLLSAAVSEGLILLLRPD
jgi:hypothetical protein